METPVVDFVRRYQAADPVRFHMPGHKGRGFLGCEAWDITEVQGADALYEARGVIAESERNAAALFGSGRTCYSTEGSSQCIRAMLYLALQAARPSGERPAILAARNVHKAFVYAAALLDFDIRWLWPEESASLCACPVSPRRLEEALEQMQSPPAAVYVTSPDYLGGMARVKELAEVCHRRGTLLAVDNAHGAYLHFLEEPCHPLDLGADLCCDSAHKTLPVLTGGAYLHLSRRLPERLRAQAKQALALFGSTSPSYLTLCSLDRCNRSLAEELPARLRRRAQEVETLRRELRRKGWETENADPLRLTLRAPHGTTGVELAARLRCKGIECEYADDSYLVFMIAPDNPPSDLERLQEALGENHAAPKAPERLPSPRGRALMSVREALFRPHELIPVQEALGRVCGAPTASCPPAIPIAVSGELIGPEAVELFRRYGVEKVEVVRDGGSFGS